VVDWASIDVVQIHPPVLYIRSGRCQGVSNHTSYAADGLPTTQSIALLPRPRFQVGEGFAWSVGEGIAY
jgi:hypothetical protein